MSRPGSTDPITWTASALSKHRTTCTSASTFLRCPRNWFPSPSPCEAPFTSPATSTNSMRVGMGFFFPRITPSFARRASGTGTMPRFGSMVQKGWLATRAPALVSALKTVDLPAFGRPTMPQENPIADQGTASGAAREG